MTDLTPLSPAALAVLGATISRWPRTRGWIVAAALRAAADQVIEEVSPVEAILAIAAELEGNANHND